MRRLAAIESAHLMSVGNSLLIHDGLAPVASDVRRLCGDLANLLGDIISIFLFDDTLLDLGSSLRKQSAQRFLDLSMIMDAFFMRLTL